MIKVRNFQDRGVSNYEWLVSYHTFSFADYYDPRHMGYGSIRVINEDRIKGGTGFGKHPHSNMEIITYVLEGGLKHQDSIGNTTIIQPGEIQLMSAGYGVIHSEFNFREDAETHFYQIWILPRLKGITPSYRQRSISTELAENKLLLLFSGSGRDHSLYIEQNIEIYLSRLLKGDVLAFKANIGQNVWIQVLKGQMKVNELEVQKGDGLAAHNEFTWHFTAQTQVEFIIFDME